MPLQVKNYNATIAKIRAIYGNRITPQDYSELASRQSISEIADYLKRNTYFSEILSPIDISTVHRGMLEDLLRRNIFEMYMKITDFERISKNEFYNYKILKAEIDEILSCISHINAKSEKLISSVPIYINGHTCYDLIGIAKIRSFPELLEFIRKTPYYDVIKNVYVNDEGKADYNSCETKLRIYYLGRLEKSINRMHNKKEADRLRFLLMTDVDLINVINSYRMTAFFDENEDAIGKIILPFSGRLSLEKQKEIYSAPTSEEFVKRFSKTYYGRQIEEAGLDMNNLEENANRLRFKYAKLALKSSASAPVSVYSFMYLMGVELQNLISIIEGVRYGLTPQKIESLIIM